MKGGRNSQSILTGSEIKRDGARLNEISRKFMKGGVKSLSPAEITAEHERLRLIEVPRIPAQLRQDRPNETIRRPNETTRRSELFSHVL